MCREKCIKHCDLDIVGIAETHLRRNESLLIPGYKWIGNNRTSLHVRAKTGSGGVGFLVKESCLTTYNVSILNQTREDVLWILCSHKFDGTSLCFCVCYLPPVDSPRGVNAEEFYDLLLQEIYEYQLRGKIIICGDFNSRIGAEHDFIQGVDVLPERLVVDYTLNSHGQTLLDFLINGNLCILNGRCGPQSNEYTCVSNKGASVVDYGLVLHEDLDLYSNFEVIRARELCAAAGFGAVGISERIIPDHSILTWDVQVPVGTADDQNYNPIKEDSSTSYTRYDLTQVPSDFMSAPEIKSLVASLVTQLNSHNLDHVYSQLCDKIVFEMEKNVPHKEIRINLTVKNKKSRKKPWWNNDLTMVWNTVRHAEQRWLKASPSDKRDHKLDYLKKRRFFDQCVQKAKRSVWIKNQDDLLALQGNSAEFWHHIGKIGMAQERKNRIPFEIIDGNGLHVTDHELVLKAWSSAFEGLLNNVDKTRSPTMLDGCVKTFMNTLPLQTTVEDLPSLFDEAISIDEISNALSRAKHGKAVGYDAVPVEALCNETVVTFLHKMYNVCLNSGQSPNVWNKGIINPIAKSSTKDVCNPLQYRGITLTSAVYKLYCSVIHERLLKWVQQEDLLSDAKNGFRRNRSTIDHLSTLTSIIESRKCKRKSTYCAFIDFRKAYDLINRDYLFYKLYHMGLKGKVFNSIYGLYQDNESCVRLNGELSDWFHVRRGLKQGCLLSPLLFSLFINSLASDIESLRNGICLNGINVSILLYADDVVLLAESELELQKQLDVLYNWCTKWQLESRKIYTKCCSTW